MKTLGNIVWVIFGGFIVALVYYVVGLFMCATIIGIPFGVQLFKFGTFTLWPFGHEIVDRPNEPSVLSVVMDVIWIACGWWEIALGHLFFGCALCVTIIGIPLGLQHFKMIVPALLPFGKTVR